MISVEISDERISITGHAGADSPRWEGKSIPCEAVTVLCNQLAASLVELTEQGEKVLSFGSGTFTVDRKGLSGESSLLVKSFLIALEMVSGEYSQYICVTKL